MPRKAIYITALALLAVGALGAALLTELGQLLNLPRSWVFAYFQYRFAISALLIAGTLGLWLWQRSSHALHRHWVGLYALAMLACLFFIHLFAPYVWLRAQQHDAQFISVAQADALLQDHTDILVLEVNGDARAYPRDWIMVPHIAGDTVGGEKVAMTYCALSDLPQAFTTEPDGKPSDYRVIAQVNNNLIFTDTQSGELYQQITGRGEYGARQPRQYPVQRMPWRSFRELYPRGRVFQPRVSQLDRITIALFKKALPDHYRGDAMFPTLSLHDRRLPNGEAVWGMAGGGEALAVPSSQLGGEDLLLRDTLGGREVIVAWFAEYQTLGAFYADRNGQSLAVTEVDPYGNSNAGALQRVHLFPGVLWMVWSHWHPATRILQPHKL